MQIKENEDDICRLAQNQTVLSLAFWGLKWYLSAQLPLVSELL